MTTTGSSWGSRENTAFTLARNVSTRYILIAINMAIGLVTRSVGYGRS